MRYLYFLYFFQQISMKRLFFFLLLCNTISVFSQDTEPQEPFNYWEVGLYTMNQNLDIENVKKELKEIYPTADFITELPKKVDHTLIYVKPVSDVSKEYPVYGIEYLNYFADGFTQAQKEKLLTTKNALICVIFYKNDAFLHTKKLSQWVYTTLKDTDFVAYDGESREYFLPDTWKTRRAEAWQDTIPNISYQTTVHSYRKGDYCRAITLGMQRFGLPDLVIENAACSSTSVANDLLIITAQLMAERPDFDTNNFVIDLDAIQNNSLQKDVQELIFENATKKATIRFKEATRDEGDPFNLLLEIDFENDNYTNVQAYQDEIYRKVFGFKDELTSVAHNEEIIAASERAKKRLPSMKKIFNNGLEANYSLLLKAPFKTDDGGNEWMWIEVVTWNEDTIEGILQNEPYYIKNLKSGTKVKVKQADIFDYILQKPDGSYEGNETGRLIQKYGN